MFSVVHGEWSGKGLFFVADFNSALLGLPRCLDLLVCNGVLKVTLLVEMISIAAGNIASFGTLNSMIPNHSEAAYNKSIGGLVVSSNT